MPFQVNHFDDQTGSFDFTKNHFVIFLERYRMKTTLIRTLLAICLAFIWSFTPRDTFGATFSLNPSADAFVTTGPTGNLSISNYGGAGALSVAASGLPQGQFQSVLQFGLAGAKSSFDSQFGIGQWSIQSVTLQLTTVPPNNPIFNASGAGQFSLSWMQNDGWTEGTGNPGLPTSNGITFSTLSNFVSGADEALGTFSFNGATNGNFIYTLGLTPSFSADILAGNTVSMRMFAADSTVSFLSDSRTIPTTSLRPLLTINAIPEPGVLALSIAAFSFVAASRVRRRP